MMEDKFQLINEHPVEDITIEFFYQPRTLTALFGILSFLIYSAFAFDSDSSDVNVWRGLCAAVLLFLIVSVLSFPNGPFTRPHPAVWRVVFGLSVLYFFLLVFLLYQRLEDSKKLLYWISPDLTNTTVPYKEYAVDCSNLSIARVWSSIDFFAFAHFTGWTAKAVLIRHYGICWTLSVTWEIVESAFTHLLPNFEECWWDAWVIDVLICNGLGIWCGMRLSKLLEMRNYHWESVRDIHSSTGKLYRCILQFTPKTFAPMRWLDPRCNKSRMIALGILIVVWQTVELNTFFLKHILDVDTEHPLVMLRIILISAISAPTIRQYYSYVTDTQCTRLGTQCWMFVAITFTETIICVKYGLALFKRTLFLNVIGLVVFLFGSGMFCVYCCMLYYNHHQELANEETLTNPDSPVRPFRPRAFRFSDSENESSICKTCSHPQFYNYNFGVNSYNHSHNLSNGAININSKSDCCCNHVNNDNDDDDDDKDDNYLRLRGAKNQTL